MPHSRRQATDGFQIVIENLRVRRQHHLNGFIAVLKIRHQHLDDNSRIQLTHLFNRLAEMFRAAVLQVIARHRRDDDVPQLHPPRRLGHAKRFISFERERLGGRNRAKAARTRAAVACDHERRRAFAPAFPMIRALGAFADCVQLQLIEQPARAREAVRRGQRDAQPFRQTRARFQFSCSHKFILTTDEHRWTPIKQKFSFVFIRVFP